MAMETVRKAIQDAVVSVRDYAKAYGTTAAARRDWKAESLTLAPVSVRVEERPLYRETFQIAAEHAATLVASFN